MKKLLFIGWDGACWPLLKPLMDAGALPHLARLVNNGTSGSLSSPPPFCCPLLWTSIATGLPPDQHGVLGESPRPDQGGAPDSRWQDKAVWQILAQHGHRTHVVNWPRTAPLTLLNGVGMADEFFTAITATGAVTGSKLDGLCQPADITSALSELPVRPDDLDAATLRLFVPDLADVDRHNDTRLPLLVRELARIFTIHSAALWALEQKPWDFAAIQLDLLTAIARQFMPFHPPRRPWISEMDFKLYQEVVNSSCRLLDLLLGRLLAAAGSESNILLCSDHGLVLGQRRKKLFTTAPAETGSGFCPGGIIVLAGPGVEKGGLIHGASIYDVAPTVLAGFEVRPAARLPGRPLMEAFVAGGKEHVWWQNQRTQATPKAVAEPLPDFPATPLPPEIFFDEPPWKSLAPIERIKTDRAWNLTQCHYYSNQPAAALPLLERLHLRHPLRLEFSLMLVECRYRMGLAEEAFRLATELHEWYPQHTYVRMYHAFAICRQGQPEAGLKMLTEIVKNSDPAPELFQSLGTIYQMLGRTDEALAAYETLLKLEPQSAAGWLGVAQSRLQRREYEAAVEAALNATAINFGSGEAHYRLGVALGHLGKNDLAIRSLETCLRLQPHRFEADRILARLYAHRPHGGPLALYHIHRYRARTTQKDEWAQAKTKLIARAREDFIRAGSELESWPLPFASNLTPPEIIIRLGSMEPGLQPNGLLPAMADPVSCLHFVAHHPHKPALLGAGALFLAPGEQSATFSIAAAPGTETEFVLPALIEGTRSLARAYDVAALEYWGMISEDSVIGAALKQAGFEPRLPLVFFRTATRQVYETTLALETKLRSKGRIPREARVCALREVNSTYAQELIRRCFKLPHFDLEQMCASGRVSADLSQVVLMKNRVVAVNLSGTVEDEVADIPFTVVDPEFRSTWALPLLWRANTACLLEAGAKICRFRTSSTFSIRMFRSAERFEAEINGQESKLVCQLK